MRRDLAGLRWVLGETLTVVVGVLIALAVDGWREERRDERTEEQYLSSLLEDLVNDFAELDRAGSQAQTAAASARTVLRVLEGQTRPLLGDSLAHAVEYAGFLYFPAYFPYTFDELVSGLQPASIAIADTSSRIRSHTVSAWWGCAVLVKKVRCTSDSTKLTWSVLKIPFRPAWTATPDLYAAVDSLVRQLDREPSPLEIRTPEGSTSILLGGDALRYLLMRDFGDTNDHPLWPAAIRLMLDGEPALMAALAGRRYQEMVGVPLMGLLMGCASGATPRRLARIRDEEPASITGAMTNQWFPEICDALPDVRLPAEHRTSFVSDVPTLFLSGGMDANTPPHQAREVAWGWPRATHLVVEHAGHESVMPQPEIQAVIRDFFNGQDVSNRQIRLSPVDFISVERARALVGGP